MFDPRIKVLKCHTCSSHGARPHSMYADPSKHQPWERRRSQIKDHVFALEEAFEQRVVLTRRTSAFVNEFPCTRLHVPLQSRHEGPMSVGEGSLNLQEAEGVTTNVVRLRQGVFDPQWVKCIGNSMVLKSRIWQLLRSRERRSDERSCML